MVALLAKNFTNFFYADQHFTNASKDATKFLIIRMVIRALDLRSLATEGTQEIRGFKKVGNFS